MFTFKISINCSYILCLIFFNVRTSNNQFLPANRITSKGNICDGSSKTALVEHFFNVIFNEFHNTPPVCVCVQMCPEQPTYCYPNGCLKKTDNKKKTPEDRSGPIPDANVEDVDAISKMFLVDDKNDFTHFLNENAEGGKSVGKIVPAKGMRPDPFKDRYKILFKYKKMPKVELRYNLREQVKHMKSDILKLETKDVSKTRWPNVNHMGITEQQVKNEKKNYGKANTSNGNDKFFVSNEESSYSSKFYKRDLRRNHKDVIEVDGEHLTDIPDHLDKMNFSIETLIDNLIGNNYGGKRDTETGALFQDSKNSDIVMTETELNSSNNDSKANEQTCVVSMNMTNQNLDENKYIEDSPLVKERMNKWQNYTFNQMIAALAKRIEQQNNTSMEILKLSSLNNDGASADKEMKPTKLDDKLKSSENKALHRNLTDKIQTVIISSDSVIKNSTLRPN